MPSPITGTVGLASLQAVHCCRHCILQSSKQNSAPFGQNQDATLLYLLFRILKCYKAWRPGRTVHAQIAEDKKMSTPYFPDHRLAETCCGSHPSWTCGLSSHKDVHGWKNSCVSSIVSNSYSKYSNTNNISLLLTPLFNQDIYLFKNNSLATKAFLWRSSLPQCLCTFFLQCKNDFFP